jgi:hypothetical protein
LTSVLQASLDEHFYLQKQLLFRGPLGQIHSTLVQSFMSAVIKKSRKISHESTSVMRLQEVAKSKENNLNFDNLLDGKRALSPSAVHQIEEFEKDDSKNIYKEVLPVSVNPQLFKMTIQIPHENMQNDN